MKREKILDKNIYDPNTRYISGPINIVRLQGEISGVKKVIYIFMDIHEPIDQQTECVNIFSQDIHKYLTDIFYKLNGSAVIYDFFLEIYAEHISQVLKNKSYYGYNYKEIYLHQLRNLFNKLFRYNFKSDTVSISDIMQNVRLHYIDIRDYFFDNFFSQSDEIQDIIDAFTASNTIDPNSLETIIGIIEKMGTDMKYFLNSFDAKITDKLSVLGHSDKSHNHAQILRQFIKKIRFTYKNTEVKNVMQELLAESKTLVRSVVTMISDMIARFIQYSEFIEKHKSKLFEHENRTYYYDIPLSDMRNMISDITDSFRELSWNILYSFNLLMDVYFLRRFLDKKYITNAIVYTGALHSRNYIYYLVRNFGFKITHVSFSRINDINKLNQEIGKIPKNKINKIEYLFYPDILQQCSNMTDFPPDFL